MAEDFHISDLLPAYALGSLDEAEAGQVADHLAICPLCRAELHIYETVAQELALAAPQIDPPSALKSRLMARIQPASTPTPAPTPATASRPPRQPWPAWLHRAAPAWGLISLILIVGLAVSNLWLWRQADQPRVAVGPEGMKAIALDNTGLAPAAAGFMLVGTDGRQGAIIVDKLPQLDETKTYQVWLIRADERISGALFSVDEFGYGGRRVVAPRPLTDYASIEITIEPADGSPRPTGQVILTGLIR